jgi:hypothetical protein
VQINEHTFGKESIRFITLGVELCACNVDEKNPICFRLGQEGTMFLEAAKCLKEGLNKIIIEFMNPEAGKMKITLTDEVKFSPA